MQGGFEWSLLPLTVEAPATGGLAEDKRPRSKLGDILMLLLVFTLPLGK